MPPEDVSITSFAAAARRRLDECEPCDGDSGCGNLYTEDDCANAAEALGDPGKVCAWTPCDEEGGGDTAAVDLDYVIRSATADTAQLCVDALAAATGDDVDAAVVAAAAAASAADVFESVTMTAKSDATAAATTTESDDDDDGAEDAGFPAVVVAGVGAVVLALLGGLIAYVGCSSKGAPRGALRWNRPVSEFTSQNPMAKDVPRDL